LIFIEEKPFLSSALIKKLIKKSLTLHAIGSALKRLAAHSISQV